MQASASAGPSPPQGKKESSFSEEKEAKRLLFIDAGRSDFSASNS
jgi:hypothetical protein